MKEKEKVRLRRRFVELRFEKVVLPERAFHMPPVLGEKLFSSMKPTPS